MPRPDIDAVIAVDSLGRDQRRRWASGIFLVAVAAPLLLLMIVMSSSSSAELKDLDGKHLSFLGHVTETGRSAFGNSPYAMVYVDDLRIDVKCYGGGAVLGLRNGQFVAISGVASGFFKGIGGSLHSCAVSAGR